ncbi:MAG: hypothetical protein H6R04_1015 [Burkholderiaceae bacterium]|nr:hypothetical protein [Burkholderiaceae bacterium]
MLTVLLALSGCATTEYKPDPRYPIHGNALGLEWGEPTKDAGKWAAKISVPVSSLQGGQSVPVAVELKLEHGVLAALHQRNGRLDRIVMLLTAERLFDGEGRQHRGTDEGMSTVLTPSGLPIEGGSQGAITSRFNTYPFRTPVDELVELPLPPLSGAQTVRFAVNAKVMPALPPGLYRLRASFGVRANHGTPAKPRHAYFDLHYAGGMTRHTFHEGSYAFSSPLLPASGKDANGKPVDAGRIQARIPWTILNGYNSNGYSGVVADEDSRHFALGQRNLIHDEVILPRVHPKGYKIAYNLEPSFPFESYYPKDNIDWNWRSGEMTLEITNPDGSRSSPVTAAIIGKSPHRHGPTTGNKEFTSWQPKSDGLYTVRVKGWMADKSGRRYEGGGSYRFWIARRMTMATATFPGAAYQVGYQYGRDIGFSPPLPAKVSISATLYPDSDPRKAKTVRSTGTANAGGVFGVAQGMKMLPLDAPGEYHARILATHTDSNGELWVCAMRHAGVVYPENSRIVARGKKLRIGNTYLARGETRIEGYNNGPADSKMPHLAFPFNAGDVLLMASENQGYNKIEPVLIAENKAAPAGKWDGKLDDIGTTNLALQTSNGLSPHMFPEYIIARQYYYGAAARPGFMARFLVADSSTRAPYWPTSPNDFGMQAGSSHNGDQPGDLYRFLGGIVRQEAGMPPDYAGYMSSGAILPRGTNNNRVIAPGSEDIIGPKGQQARFFLTPSFRPGMAYLQGATWRPVLQIDPMLPVKITLTLTAPDGSIQTESGIASATDGTWAGRVRQLQQSGIYHYRISANWEGHSGTIPGLPANGGEFYVMGTRPPGAKGLRLDQPKEAVFSLADKLRFKGQSSATRVHYALIMPGAVIAQGSVPVVNGKFELAFDPAEINRTTPIYDLTNRVSGESWGEQEPKNQWKTTRKILHLSLFSKERTPDGSVFWDFHRVITRGTTVLSVEAK